MSCWWIFFHEWTKWSDPYALHHTPIDEVGNVLGPGYKTWHQHRVCKKCRRIAVCKYK